MILSAAQLAQVAAGAGFSGQDLVTAVAVALAESGGHTGPEPEGWNQNGEDSRGPWQINVGPGAHTQWAGDNLFDPSVNAARAYQLYTSNGGFYDWTTYTRGAYLAKWSQAQQGVAALGSGNVATAPAPNPSSTIPPSSGPLSSIGMGDVPTSNASLGWIIVCTLGALILVNEVLG